MVKWLGTSTITLLIIICIGFGVQHYYNNSRFGGPKYGLLIQNGNIIIDGIDAYFIKYNKYPEDLSDLKPEFLSEIKKPQYSNCDWIYINYTGYYRLGLGTIDKTSLDFFYDSASSEWGFKKTSDTVINTFHNN